MALPLDLTTEDGLRAYLKTTGGFEVADVTVLSGGTANYVYRVSGTHGSTRIFKHAAPYFQSNENLDFDPTRMDYEARVLAILSSTEGPLSKRLPNSAVHVVRLVSYDKEQKLLCVEDGGAQNLKDAYDEPNLNIPRVGEELGWWIATLHMCSKDISLALPDHDSSVEGSNNNPVAVDMYRYLYNHFHEALSKHGHDTKLADRINEEFGSLIATDDECICHGDCWPGNILVQLPSSPEEPADITMIDWEMVRRGTSAADVGQFAAEAFLLDRFKGARGLLPAFLNAYAAARHSDADDTTKLDKVWLRRMAVHWAVHVAFWPTRVAWTDEDGTQQLVNIGVRVLMDVQDDDWEKLLASPLLQDVNEAYGPMLTRA